MTTIDYYAALGVPPTATPSQIREAYKRAALKTHPDRVSHNDPTRASRTKRFQEVNDAYYILSDPIRRRDYDSTRRSSSSSTSQEQHASAETQDTQFSDVFEEMLRDEGLNDDGTPRAGSGSIWSLLGGIGGATLGFIVGNLPGLMVGAVAGNRLGAVRDRKGKSVYEAFQELPQADKAKLLSDLAAKILTHAVSA
ncbi:DnaJ-domain-containing protein [Ascodesmis nigricans]|uniref:DnaJ-domain-containing protein n=1 Tax=Ascodesmis nigricans TaxID=341454 RepID=A0A4S2MV24_9PEZI|nr:DnaJ-domain-containing protein [Ascodesmis nigricans]